jgi:hypothetical protein
MPGKRSLRPSQGKQGILGPIISRAFDLDRQLRILCYLLVQCFREDQGVNEMIDATRRMLDDVMEKLEPKMIFVHEGTESAPLRKILSEHHKEVREFIKKMAYSYRILSDISTDEDANNLESEGESIEDSRVVSNPFGVSSDNPKKRKSIFWALLIFRAIARGFEKCKRGSVW